MPSGPDIVVHAEREQRAPADHARLSLPTGAADPMLPVPYRIRRKRREIHDTVTLDLEPADGGACVPCEPGQFNMLYVFGVGEAPISASGDPANQEFVRHTIRAVGAVTRPMAELKRSDVLGLRGPFGTSWPIAAAAGRDIVVVAGGLGLAPLRPALYRLLAERKRYGRVVLLYGARGPQEILFRAELDRWRKKADLNVHVTVDRATPEWKGHVGVVTTLMSRAGVDPTTALVMICGPEVMMRFSAMELQRRGITPERIYVSMERNMKCAVGFCGHCQFGAAFVCKDGPIFRFDRVARLFATPEV